MVFVLEYWNVVMLIDISNKYMYYDKERVW